MAIGLPEQDLVVGFLTVHHGGGDPWKGAVQFLIVHNHKRLWVDVMLSVCVGSNAFKILYFLNLTPI